MLSGRMFGQLQATLCVYIGRKTRTTVANYSHFSQNMTSGSTSQQKLPIPIKALLRSSIYGKSMTWMVVAQHITTEPDNGQKDIKGSPGGGSECV